MRVGLRQLRVPLTVGAGGSVRLRAAKWLAGSVLVAVPLVGGVLWLFQRGGTLWGPALGLPLLPVVYFATEVVTGVPVPQLSARWDALAGWQRGLLGTVIVLVCAVAIFGGVGAVLVLLAE